MYGDEHATTTVKRKVTRRVSASRVSKENIYEQVKSPIHICCENIYTILVAICVITAIVLFVLLAVNDNHYSRRRNKDGYYDEDYLLHGSLNKYVRDYTRYADVYLHNTAKPLDRLVHELWNWDHAPDPGDISDLIYKRHGVIHSECYNETHYEYSNCSQVYHDYYYNPSPEDDDESGPKRENEDYWLHERDLSDRSSLFWLWGQFIDHTLVRTDPNPHESLYTGHHRLASHRTEYIVDHYGKRQQINFLSPFLDGSMLYGSDHGHQHLLRKYVKGKLKYSVNPVHIPSYSESETHKDQYHDSNNYRDYQGNTRKLSLDSWFSDYSYDGDRSLLPFNDTTGHYYAGDARAEEHFLLTAMHTLWVREHNHWCERLYREHPDWDDERLYVFARMIVTGEMQAITYNEWLPLLLGTRSLYGRDAYYVKQPYDVEVDKHTASPSHSEDDDDAKEEDVYHNRSGFDEDQEQNKLTLKNYKRSQLTTSEREERDQEEEESFDDWRSSSYDHLESGDEKNHHSSFPRYPYVVSFKTSKARMYNEFATAAFRFGHTMVNEDMHYRDPYSARLTKKISLKDMFFERTPVPDGTVWHDGIDGWLLGAMKKSANKISPRMVSSLREHLFEHADPPETLDLAARNIARGRDHGIPSYQRMYAWATNGKRHMTRCYQMSDSQRLCNRIERLYGMSGDIDLWVGITCENKRKGSMLGMVGSEIVAEQFSDIRNNDPYFYLWNDLIRAYKNEVHSTRLSSIILRNTAINPIHVSKDAFIHRPEEREEYY